jgi:hypothetical protein
MILQIDTIGVACARLTPPRSSPHQSIVRLSIQFDIFPSVIEPDLALLQKASNSCRVSNRSNRANCDVVNFRSRYASSAIASNAARGRSELEEASTDDNSSGISMVTCHGSSIGQLERPRRKPRGRMNHKPKQKMTNAPDPASAPYPSPRRRTSLQVKRQERPVRRPTDSSPRAVHGRAPAPVVRR